MTTEPDLYSDAATLVTPRDSVERRLDGYMASALTGLTGDAKRSVHLICDLVATVCRAYQIDLYEPRKRTDPVHNAEIEDHVVYFTDRDRVSSADVVFLLCDHPSFGAGQELEIANAATVPIVLIVTTIGGKVSRMVTGSTGLQHQLRKEEPEDLRAALADLLVALVPQLQARRMRLADAQLPDLGPRVVSARRHLGMDREELAAMVGVREEWVRQLETQPLPTVNPSLRQLSMVACALGRDLGELLSNDYRLTASGDAAGVRIPTALVEASIEKRASAVSMILAARTAARAGNCLTWSKGDWTPILEVIEANGQAAQNSTGA